MLMVLMAASGRCRLLAGGWQADKEARCHRTSASRGVSCSSAAGPAETRVTLSPSADYSRWRSAGASALRRSR